jgi:type III pantothenate kinase
MILCVDIGNTNVVMGLFDGGSLAASARFATTNMRTTDECGFRAQGVLRKYSPESEVRLDGAVVASVVPSLKPYVIEMSREYLKCDPIVVSSDLEIGLNLVVENPREVGADRIANSIAALELYNDTCIIIDFGTATTLDVVTSRREYLGGVIAPGVETASHNLVQRAAQLFSVDVAPSKNVIGRSTEDCMKSGIFWGQVEMINGLIIRMEDELQEECRIVLTGGLGNLFSEYIDREATFEPHLTLIGMQRIYEKLT